jgi:hypothetical protein
VTYTGTVVPILQNNCYGCHSSSAGTTNGGIDLTDYNTVAWLAQSGTLAGVINHAEGFTAMPPTGKLDSCEIVQIEKWINDTTFTDPGGGGNGGHPCDPDSVYFQNTILPLIASSCATTGCHNQLTDEQDILLIDYASIIAYGEIVPGDPEESKLYEAITDDDPDDRMPPPPNDPLTAEQIEKIRTWIVQGALDNSCDGDCDTTNVTFSGTVWPIIQNSCYGCHSGSNPGGNIFLRNHADVAAAVNSGRLWGAVNHEPGFSRMPKVGPKLPECNLAAIRIWIDEGMPDN